MNLSDIRLRVLDLIGDPNGYRWAPGNDYARLDRAINDAQQDVSVIAERVDPSVLASTVLITVTRPAAIAGATGFPEEGLPSDFRRLILMLRTDVSPSRPVQVVSVDRAAFYKNLDDADVVYLRRLIGTSTAVVGFASMASTGDDATYALHYAARASDLAGDPGSVTSMLPSEYHDIIVLRAAIKLLLQENADVSELRKEETKLIGAMVESLPTREGVLVGGTR